MKYRKGIEISDATEEELLRYQMEKIAKESCSEDLSGESTALAELYKSLKNTEIEEILQSIDGTLKRIEELLSNKSDVTVITSRIMGYITDVLEKSQKEFSKASPKYHWD